MGGIGKQEGRRSGGDGGRKGIGGQEEWEGMGRGKGSGDRRERRRGKGRGLTALNIMCRGRGMSKLSE